jgi:hypothetical protein
MTISVRQFTALALACCAIVASAMFLRPAPVDAATGDLVTITDPSSATRKAKVTAAGRLYTAPCDSDACAAVSPQGRLYVTACDSDSCTATDGNRLLVDNRPSAPKTPWNTINDQTLSASDTRRPMYASLGTPKLNITSVIASAEGSTAGSVELLFIAYVKSNSTSGDCETLSGGFGAAERFTVMVPVGQTVNVTFPTPLQYTQYADSNDYWCFDVESYGGPSGYTAHVTVSGFKS